MFKKNIYILLLVLLITSCSSMDAVKRGITGEKRISTDEFLIQKKDPLILPPDYENLPTPDEQRAAKEEILSFEKSLANAIEEDIPSAGSAEKSILRKIRSK